MALFAGDRDIMTGEELTYDYNFDPYSQKNVQVCRCGAKSCRGVLGPKPKEERKQKSPEEEVKKTEGKLAGAKRKLVEVIEESTSRINKKRKLTKATAKVYGLESQSSLKSPKKPMLIKKTATRKVSMPGDQGLTRRPSQLKRLIAGAKEKTSGKRVVSASSATEALIAKEEVKPLARSSSLREKASSLRRNVVRTVRGAPSGNERSIRSVDDVAE